MFLLLSSDMRGARVGEPGDRRLEGREDGSPDRAGAEERSRCDMGTTAVEPLDVKALGPGIPVPEGFIVSGKRREVALLDGVVGGLRC